MANDIPMRQIRAKYSADTITVYQAYNDAIANAAITAQRFVPPFKTDRMTWIKPSFLWMMYRLGWATKPGQTRVLAVQIRRSGFDWALEHSVLSHFNPDVHESREAWKGALSCASVRVQWDPERSVSLEKLHYRTIQVGLSAESSSRYADDWIHNISDVTALAQKTHSAVLSKDADIARLMLPIELPYPLTSNIARTIGVGSVG